MFFVIMDSIYNNYTRSKICHKRFRREKKYRYRILPKQYYNNTRQNNNNYHFVRTYE